MRRVALWIVVGLLVVALGLIAAIRLAPDDPAVWHVDPLTAGRAGGANSYFVAPEGDRVSPIYTIDAATLAKAFDDFALAQPRVIRLAGGPEVRWTTYVQRSVVIGFPDYISVRAVDLGEGRSALAVYSRSRYGRRDFGVNRARMSAWLDALDTFAE